jgi:hypothetical protein
VGLQLFNYNMLQYLQVSQVEHVYVLDKNN